LSEYRELLAGAKQQKTLVELPSEWLPESRSRKTFVIRRRRMLTVTGAGYTIWLIASDSIHESTRIREEEWYRVEYPTSLSKAGRDVGFFYLKWEDILQ
jgi:hypothetical protein